MQTTINNIKKIITDNKSGSVELVNNLIITLLNNNLQFIFLNNKNELSNLLVELKNEQNTFINLTNFIDKLINIIDLSDFQWFVLTLYAEKKYYKNLNNLILQKFLDFNIKFDSCLLHSNSSTIKNLFNSLKNTNYKIQTIYQTISNPGGEGKIQADFLESIGYTVKIIDESNLSNYVDYIDIAIFGSDAVCKNSYFINKIKTKKISETLQKAKKTTIVISDKNKMIKPSSTNYLFDITLFEKIPCNLITKTIIV